jgi:hypothetical protein
LTAVDDAHRLSDAEREETVVFLREHLLAGRLTLDEFSDRVGVVYGARVGQELLPVRADLPDTPVAVSGPRRKPTRLTLALFAHVVRRGRMRLRRRTLAAGVFSDIDLDLREAEVERRETTVFVLTAFSNADIYVPEGVNVDFGGLTIFGHYREWGADRARPGSPTVHVRAFGLFTTIDLWRVPPDVRGTYSEIFRQLQGNERSLPHGGR